MTRGEAGMTRGDDWAGGDCRGRRCRIVGLGAGCEGAVRGCGGLAVDRSGQGVYHPARDGAGGYCARCAGDGRRCKGLLKNPLRGGSTGCQ